jgi:hypothetical protein
MFLIVFVPYLTHDAVLDPEAENSTEVVHPCSPWMPWHEEFRPLQKNVDTDDTDKNKFF